MRHSWTSPFTGPPAPQRPRAPAPLRPSVLLALTLLARRPARVRGPAGHPLAPGHRGAGASRLRDRGGARAARLRFRRARRHAGAGPGPVVGSPAASPYDSLPAPATIAAALELMPACAEGADAGRFVFALDLRSGSVATAGAPAPADAARVAEPGGAAASRDSEPPGAADRGTTGWRCIGSRRSATAASRPTTPRSPPTAWWSAARRSRRCSPGRSCAGRCSRRRSRAGYRTPSWLRSRCATPDDRLLWHAGPLAGSEYAGAPAADSARGLTARAAFPPAVAAAAGPGRAPEPAPGAAPAARAHGRSRRDRLPAAPPGAGAGPAPRRLHQRACRTSSGPRSPRSCSTPRRSSWDGWSVKTSGARRSA